MRVDRARSRLRTGAQQPDVPPVTMRAAGLVKVARATTPEKLRALIEALIVKLGAMLDEVETIEGGMRYGT